MTFAPRVQASPLWLILVLSNSLAAAACGEDLRDDLALVRQSLEKNGKKLRSLRGKYEVVEASSKEQADRLGRVPGTLDMRVAFEFAGEPLELEKVHEVHDDEVRIGSLRYWLSNLRLRDMNDAWVDIPDSYFLMEHTTKVVYPDSGAEPEWVPKLRDSIALRDVPAGTYGAVGFCIGVDAEHNDDLTRSGGELNVLSNMAKASWMWYTSYIFTSLYAHMRPSTFDDDDEEVILGWQTGNNEELRCIELDLPDQVTVAFEREASIEVALDSSRLFDYMTLQAIRAGATDPESPTSYIGPSDDKALLRVISNSWSYAFAAKSACCGPTP